MKESDPPKIGSDLTGFEFRHLARTMFLPHAIMAADKGATAPMLEVERPTDRRSRKEAAIPSLTVMSLVLSTIPQTFEALTLGIVVAAIGFADRMGPVINMMQNSDLSPSRWRSVFPVLWRMIVGTGTADGHHLFGRVVSPAG